LLAIVKSSRRDILLLLLLSPLSPLCRVFIHIFLRQTISLRNTILLLLLLLLLLLSPLFRVLLSLSLLLTLIELSLGGRCPYTGTDKKIRINIYINEAI
jgi:hypothetical protein